MFILCWHYVRAFLLIYLCLYIGNLISSVLPVAIPGSIIGMLLLFTLLAFHIVPDVWVRPGCQLMIRYMTLLFVPIGVGIMKYYDLIVSQFGAVVVSCLVSTFIVLLVVGYSAHWTYREKTDSK